MGNLQNSYVKLDKVSKIYKMGEVEIRAVDNISFEISKGEFVVVVGPSGAGKTTGSEYSWWNGHSDKRKCFCGWQQHCEI